MKWIWRIDVFCDLNNNTMDIDIIKLAKECPGAILSVSAADLVAANKALIETTKREMAELLERKGPHLLTREMVMEKLNIVPSTLWRWAKSGYLVPVNVGGQRRYKSTDVDEILEGNGNGKARIQGLEAQIKALNAELEEVRGWDISSERAQKWNELTSRINKAKQRLDEVKKELI